MNTTYGKKIAIQTDLELKIWCQATGGGGRNPLRQLALTRRHSDILRRSDACIILTLPRKLRPSGNTHNTVAKVNKGLFVKRLGENISKLVDRRNMDNVNKSGNNVGTKVIQTNG